MKLIKRMPMVMLATSFLAAVPGAVEGQLAPPAGPNDAASALFTHGDIFNRLATGAAGVKRGGTFAEPAAGPTVSASKTTDEIMAVAPVADNTNGATAADVAAGKTFWGLRTTGGTWGPTTGTATGGGSSYPAPVEKTGQTQCYKSGGSGWVLDEGCATNTPANQDGKLQRGVAWPNPRFTKNNDGTVTDNLTGLIWLANANCVDMKTWADAVTSANALAHGACGLNDNSTVGQWRLPNVKELQSLIDYAYFEPAVPNTAGTGQWSAGDPFTNVQNFYYWTSSSLVFNLPSAWVVLVNTGFVYYYDRTSAAYVWPVRGGQ